MKKRIHILLTFLFVFILSATLSSCSSSKNIVFENNVENITPETSLTFFGFKYEALNVMAIENTLHSYMDKYPTVNISYDGIKSPEYFDILEKRIATGNGNDIFMVDHERVLELIEQNKLVSLSDLSTLNDFSELAKSQMSAHGDIYYVPTSISAFGLYCNNDLLKKHGQNIPQNFSEFEKVCNYFVDNGITPIVSNNDISLKTIAIAKSMLPTYQNDNTSEIIEHFNQAPSDLCETLRPGFELVEQMIKHNWIDSEEALNTAKTKDDLVVFAKGEQPFMLTGAWAVPRLRELKPDFEFSVQPYPIMEDGSVLVINVDTRISVNADSHNIEEAKQFVEYFTQKSVMWEFVDSQSSFSPLKENRLAQDKAIQSIGSYLTNGRSVFGSDDNIEYPIWDITRKCIVGMLQGDSAQTAVENMNQLISKDVNTEMEEFE